MYRRGDPRWNRTIQNIADNVEHANLSTQEHLWTFTHEYINPCLGSITHCLNACTAPCFPSRDDRRRHRARSRGRAELSFDFYDDWDEDESEGLLGGWGNDNFDRLISGSGGGGGSSSTYGAVSSSQPGRQRGMSYGARTRDARYNTGRRKSAVQPHDGGPDPTIIPSSSYFGFLGRLPWKLGGGRGLRYKPSAADLVEHPGQGRRSLEEQQPLIEESEEDGFAYGRSRREGKGQGHGHQRQRSHTHSSGHTTDSLSSRGDIFPSEDELDDAVPLDDEFTMALERRTTGQWDTDTSSGKTGKKAPSNSRTSTRTASSRNSKQETEQNRSSENMPVKLSASVPEGTTLSDLKEEEERIRMEEEQEVERKRRDAQQLALKRGLASDPSLDTQAQPAQTSPYIPSQTPTIPKSESQPETSTLHPPSHLPIDDTTPSPTFEEPQTAPDSGGFHVDESDFSSFAPTPNRPLSVKDHPRETKADEEFLPARLPHFSTQPD